MRFPHRKYDVIGLGVSTLDFLQIVEELPGKELVQRAEKSALCGGGPVATALVALARLGSRTAMVDRLGDDWRGDLIREEFLREGVATDFLEIEPDRSSSMASVLVRRSDGARTIVYSPGDATELTDIARETVASAGILHLNGRHFPAALRAAQVAREEGVLVSFDGGAHRFHDRLRQLVPLTDLCIVARQFASAYSGNDDLSRSVECIMTSGPRIVVVTAGTEGSWIFEREKEPVHQPAFQLEHAVDTTGAGDAFHGGFLHGLIAGLPLPACAAFASAVAALSTRYLGGRPGLPSRQETSSFVADRGVII